MANFDKPVPADLEIATRLQNEREMNVALAQMSTSSALGKVPGIVDLSAPGSYDRTLAQYNGTVYTGFNLKVDKLTVNGGTLDLGFSGSSVNASSIDTFLQGDAGDYLQFVKSSNIWNFAIGSVVKFSVYGETSTYNQIFRHQAAADLYTIKSKTNAPLNQKNWFTIQSDSEFISYLVNDAGAATDFYDIIRRTGAALTSRSLNASAGRLLVGQGLTDDGSAMLQTGTLKATSLTLTAQPSVTDCTGNATATAANADHVLTINARTLAGGVVINGANTTITVPKSGKYILNLEVAIIPSGNAIATIALHKNAAFHRTLDQITTNGSSAFSRKSLVLTLAAWDNISFVANPSLFGATFYIDYLNLIQLN